MIDDQGLERVNYRRVQHRLTLQRLVPGRPRQPDGAVRPSDRESVLGRQGLEGLTRAISVTVFD